MTSRILEIQQLKFVLHAENPRLNLADLDRPTGFNPLARVPEDLKPIVTDGVVAAFHHVWPGSWGPRLDYMLTNAVRALHDVPGGTLLMLPRLLVDNAFRAELIDRHVSDPVVRSFWINEYEGYAASFRDEAISPIQNKIGKALMVPSLHNMLAQPKSTITFRHLMDKGRDRNLLLPKARSARAPPACLVRSSPPPWPKPPYPAPTLRPLIDGSSISMPTSSRRSPPKASPSFCRKRASTG